MPRFNRSALLEVSATLAHTVITDVERYPEFLPGCEAVTVRERFADGLVAEVTVHGAGMTRSFVTRNQHSPTQVTMSLVEGPLSELEGRWQLAPIGDLGCRVEVQIDYTLAGPLAVLFGGMAERVVDRLVAAFTQRIEALSSD